MKYFLIAGEKSGDLHGAELMKGLKQNDAKAEFIGMGGEAMLAAGLHQILDYQKVSFMGFVDVILNLIVIRRYLATCKKCIYQEKPDVVIAIDFPGFNLRLLQFAKKSGINTCYYISPKLWAWNKSRIDKIRKCVDLMLVVFPFEVKFYEELDFRVTYVGNPTLESINNHVWDLPFIEKIQSQSSNVAILLGSRWREVSEAIQIIKPFINRNKSTHFHVAALVGIDVNLYEELSTIENCHVHYGKTYDLLRACDRAIVTSGTATLEAALIGIPQVVVYKTSFLTYYLAQLLLKIQFISLVNILSEEKIVAELIQNNFNIENLKVELDRFDDISQKNRILAQYANIRLKLGVKKASNRAAQEIRQKFGTKQL